MILNFCATLFSRLLPSDYRTENALQWWHKRQVDRLHDGAELIRDGILQELFAVRRGLEMISYGSEPALQTKLEGSLQQLESLHTQLETVSNALSPAFIRDSIPLAVQHALQGWQQRYPQIKLTSQLPQASPREPSLASRIAFTTLEELMTLISGAFESDILINIDLQYEETLSALTVNLSHLTRSQRQAIAQMRQLDALRRSFEFLTAGEAVQSIGDTQIQWRFSWPTGDRPYCE